MTSGQELGDTHVDSSEVLYVLTLLLAFHKHMSLKALPEEKKKKERNTSESNKLG